MVVDIDAPLAPDKLPELAHYAERYERCQVEQQDTDLVDRHTAVVDGVECLIGELEPLAVQPAYPAVGKYQYTESHEQDRVVDHQRPQQQTE